MNTILTNKIHAIASDIAKENNVDLTKVSEPEIWIEWLRCYFSACVKLRDDMYKQGLLNTVAAIQEIIDFNKKILRKPEELEVVNSVLAEELADLDSIG